MKSKPDYLSNIIIVQKVQREQILNYKNETDISRPDPQKPITSIEVFQKMEKNINEMRLENGQEEV